MKTIIGDLISLIVGNTDEDFKPTKNHYFMFYMMMGTVVLVALISYFVW